MPTLHDHDSKLNLLQRVFTFSLTYLQYIFLIKVEDQDPCELELKLQIEHAITSLDKENEIIVDTIDEKDSELIIEEDVERPLKIPEEGKADEVPSRDHTSNLRENIYIYIYFIWLIHLFSQFCFIAWNCLK